MQMREANYAADDNSHWWATKIGFTMVKTRNAYKEICKMLLIPDYFPVVYFDVRFLYFCAKVFC